MKVARERNLALETERSYCGWINRFCDWKLQGNLEGGPQEYLKLAHRLPGLKLTYRDGKTALHGTFDEGIIVVMPLGATTLTQIAAAKQWPAETEAPQS